MTSGKVAEGEGIFKNLTLGKNSMDDELRIQSTHRKAFTKTVFGRIALLTFVSFD